MWSKLIGKPFKNGGRGPDEFDCWGLVRFIYLQKYGLELPNFIIDCYDLNKINLTYNEQQSKFIKVEKPAEPAIIAFHKNQLVFHVAVYIGGGKFIHAHEKANVCIECLDHPYWRRRVAGFYLPGWLNEKK